MTLGSDQLRLVLGLKARALRAVRGWTLQQLAVRAGLAVSYLSEIEKGKKYPKPEKLLALARALETPYEELVSPRLDDELSPLSTFAASDFVREFPFEVFGLEAGDLFELVAADPKRAGALLRALGDIARRYDLAVEQLLFAALRSYQQLNGNFFPDLEEAAERFRAEAGWTGRDSLRERDLRGVLERRFGVRIDLETLTSRRELADLRSLFAAGPPPVLHLNSRLLPQQRAFAMAREVGFRVLGIGERVIAGSWVRAESFEQVLGNFRASYFAGALMIPRAALAEELTAFLSAPRFRPAALPAALRRFGATPEMLFYRVSQIAPADLGLGDLFFVRFFRESGSSKPRLTKVLNLSRVAVPYDVSPEEHSCRRWPGVASLGSRAGAAALPGKTPVAAAICRFQSEPVEFLVLALSRRLALQPRTLSSVSLGFLVDDRLRGAVRFLEDPALPRREVDLTCERCPLDETACPERAAPPSVLERDRRRARREAAIAELANAEAGAAGPGPSAVRMPPP